MDNKYVCISVLLHLKKTLLSYEKPQGLKIPVLGTGSGVTVYFLGSYTLCVGKKNRLIPQIVQTDNTHACLLFLFVVL